MTLTISRRGLLGSLLAAPVIIQSNNLMRLSAPYLWGDGIHDDTYAIQWRLNRIRAGQHLLLADMSFYLTKHLVYNGPGLVTFRRVGFVRDAGAYYLMNHYRDWAPIPSARLATWVRDTNYG